MSYANSILLIVFVHKVLNKVNQNLLLYSLKILTQGIVLGIAYKNSI